MARIKDEAGVALITVLLVGSALTVVASTATFVTIHEFGSGRDDRRASEALSYAEAGIDRMLGYLRSGKVTYGGLNKAGCAGQVSFGTAPITLGPSNIGLGNYVAQLTVYNPEAATVADRFPPAACTNRPASPHPGQIPGDQNDRTYFVITSTGQHPAATRVVRQVIAIEPIDLPVGLYGYAFDNKAHPKFRTVSMFSKTVINDREKDSFVGTDQYYFMKDIFPDGVVGRSPDELAPAAPHAAQGIFLKKSSNPEFPGPVAPTTRHCSANSTIGVPGAVASQSLWDTDGSSGTGPLTTGCTDQTGYPVTSKFTSEMIEKFSRPVLSPEDHQALKEAAIQGGVYCSFPGVGGTGTTTCYKQGTLIGAADYNAYVQQVIAGGQKNLIAYYEFRSGTATQNAISWDGDVWPCSDDTSINQSIVLIVKNGGVDITGAGGDKINGVLYMDGNYNSTGRLDINGSLIAHGTVSFGSSSEEITLDSCWVRNMPAPVFRVVPGQWSEVDR